MPFAFIILLVFSLSGLWCSPFSQPSSHLQFLPSSSTTAVRSTQTHTSLLNDLLSSVEAGDYLRALSSYAARLVLLHRPSLLRVAPPAASSSFSNTLLSHFFFLETCITSTLQPLSRLRTCNVSSSLKPFSS